jgi:hypothetical protein
MTGSAPRALHAIGIVLSHTMRRHPPASPAAPPLADRDDWKTLRTLFPYLW